MLHQLFATVHFINYILFFNEHSSMNNEDDCTNLIAIKLFFNWVVRVYEALIISFIIYYFNNIYDRNQVKVVDVL